MSDFFLEAFRSISLFHSLDKDFLRERIKNIPFHQKKTQHK